MPPPGRVVYSSGQGRMCPVCGWPQDDCRCSKTLSAGAAAVPDKVTAKLRLENRSSGKHVTVVDGLPDNRAFLDTLGRELKKACGNGWIGRREWRSSCRATSASGSGSCS